MLAFTEPNSSLLGGLDILAADLLSSLLGTLEEVLDGVVEDTGLSVADDGEEDGIDLAK